MALPEMTDEQRAAGLAKAVEVRKARAAIAAELKAGEKTVAEVFDAVSEDKAHPAAGMRIKAVLGALSGYGPKRVTDLLDEAGVDPTHKVTRIGESKRHTLLGLLSRTAAR